MTLLQPAMLWGLAAASIPILIHLLNRLRYRSVKWAAMLFLIKAARSSTRNARLRHYLILFCRTMAVLLFAWALCRPLTGGWLGTVLGGSPEMVIVLLDRSASMEATDPRQQASRRQMALRMLAEAARTVGRTTRYVLIDSARVAPQEVASLEALAAMASAAPSDTAADWPALFRAAADHLQRHQPGRPEIWVASDLQESNWRPAAGEWSALASRFAALPQKIRIRILGLGGAAARNCSLSLRDVQVVRAAGRPRVQAALTCLGPAAAGADVPLAEVVNGRRATYEFERRASRVDFTRTLDVAEDEVSQGWGMFALPADENARDNEVYLVYGGAAERRAAVFAESSAIGRVLQLAVAPSAALPGVCEVHTPTTTLPPLGAHAMVAWQGAMPAGEAAAALERFAGDGGSVLLLPPAGSGGDPAWGLAWSAAEAAPPERPFRVASWEEREGPLADTADGRHLPVPELAVTRRVVPTASGDSPEGGRWTALAAFVDGRPFLMRRPVGRGWMYAVATLPDPADSNLPEGWILVPMIQRLLAQGAGRLAGVELAWCGEWRPGSAGERWAPVGGGETADPLTRAGVYRSGARMVALNRPPAEDDPETVDAARIRRLFPGVDVTVSDVLAGGKTPMPTEIWPAMVVLGLLFLAAESLLVLAETVPARTAAAGGTGP